MPVYVESRLIQALMAWLMLVTVWYDGEPFEYGYECGSIALSEKTAREYAKTKKFERRALACFLAEVHLGEAFDDVELRSPTQQAEV